MMRKCLLRKQRHVATDCQWEDKRKKQNCIGKALIGGIDRSRETLYSAHLFDDRHDWYHWEAAREAVCDERAIALHVARRVRESLQLVDQPQIGRGQTLESAAQPRHRRIGHSAQNGERRVVVPKVDAVFWDRGTKQLILNRMRKVCSA